MAFTRPKAAQIDFDVTNISDPLIRLNSAETGSADKDVGIVIERGDDTNVAIIYDESANEFAVINTTETGTTSGNVTIASYADIRAGAATFAGTLSAGATDVTTLTASGDVAINTDTLLVDVSTETIGVKMTPDVLGAPLQIQHDGTIAYLGLDGGNSDTDPFLSTWSDPDPASALFGWSFFNRSTDGNLRLSRRNNSTTDTEVLTIVRSTGNATFAGTLSAGAIAMGTNKITGMGDPTSAQDAATKAYVDSQSSGGGVSTGKSIAMAIVFG